MQEIIFNRDAVIEQLISKDWDKTESVKYMIQNPPTDQEVESFLEKEALSLLQN